MAETEKNNIGFITKIALLADAAEEIFPNGKRAVVFELNEEDFNKSKKELLVPENGMNQFKVDMSGTEFIFLKDGLLTDAEDKI